MRISWCVEVQVSVRCTYRSWVAKGGICQLSIYCLSPLNLDFVQALWNLGLKVYYFSFASWHNVRPCQQRAPEGHRKKGFFFLLLWCDGQLEASGGIPSYAHRPESFNSTPAGLAHTLASSLPMRLTSNPTGDFCLIALAWEFLHHLVGYSQTLSIKIWISALMEHPPSFFLSWVLSLSLEAVAAPCIFYSCILYRNSFYQFKFFILN